MRLPSCFDDLGTHSSPSRAGFAKGLVPVPKTRSSPQPTAALLEEVRCLGLAVFLNEDATSRYITGKPLCALGKGPNQSLVQLACCDNPQLGVMAHSTLIWLAEPLFTQHQLFPVLLPVPEHLKKQNMNRNPPLQNLRGFPLPWLLQKPLCTSCGRLLASGN